MTLRNQLLSDAAALVKRGLLDGSRLRQIKGGTGYLNTAMDLGVLAHVLGEAWSAIASKSAVQASELDEAERLYQQLMNAYALRNQRSSSVAAATDDRQRAYTLLVRAYDQARRAMTYLRWAENDADTLVPSLWRDRGGRGKKARAVKAPTHATGSTGATPATVDPSASLPSLPEAPPQVPAVPVGFPGSSPFAN